MLSEQECASSAGSELDNLHKVRKATRLLVALGLLMILVSVHLMRTSPASLVAIVLTLAIGVALPFLSIFPVIRLRRGSRVLWIRRFHQGGHAASEQAWLETGVNPWGQLITLSDTTVRSDADSRMMLTLKFLLILVAAILIGQLLGGTFGPRGVISAVGGASLFLAFRYLGVWRARLDLRSQEWTAEIRTKVLKRVQSRKLTSHGTIVVRCPPDGELWREVIVVLAHRVDAAIISIRESSPSLDWEIATLASSLGIGKLIVLLDNDSEPVPQTLKRAHILRLPAGSATWWVRMRHQRSVALVVGTAILMGRQSELAEC